VAYYVNYLNLILIFAIYAMSLNLLMGYAGQISIAHAAFGAVGGYGAGYVSASAGAPFLASLAVGVAAAFVIGVIVSLPALRLSAEYLILLTLATSTIIIVIATSSEAFGGLYGLLGIQLPSLFGEQFTTVNDFLWLLLALSALVFFVCWRLAESPFGRVLRGIREDEMATRSLGKNVFVKKVVVFGVTSAMAGLAGALLVFYNSLASPGQFGIDQSLEIIAMVVIGGLGNLIGSVVGAAVIVALQPFLERVVDMDPDKASLVRLLIFGLALVAVLLVRPQGLVPEGFPNLSRWRSRRRRALLSPEAAPQANGAAPAPLVAAALEGDRPPRSTVPVVEVRDLTRHFGGIRAVDNLELELAPGCVTGLIGPNGAGKTTVFNLLTGTIKPDRGVVRLRGRDVTGLSPNHIARAGMVRSFQDVRIFQRLTVLENVMLGVQGQPGESAAELFLLPWRTMRAERRTRAAAMANLEFAGLTDRADEPAGSLSFGEQKLVALARMLATEAEVFLLDEPSSGIDHRWVERMLEVIGALRARGATICIVEHNLHVVEQLADKIYFMEEGRVSAEGTMQDLVKQERLLEAYFGSL
jgi:branched-chain amino acid transport system permease protein